MKGIVFKCIVYFSFFLIFMLNRKLSLIKNIMNVFAHFWIFLFLVKIIVACSSHSPFTPTLVHSYTIRTELYPLGDDISKHLQAPHLNCAKWGLLIRSAGSWISCKTDGPLKASCKEALLTNIVHLKVGNWKSARTQTSPSFIFIAKQTNIIYIKMFPLSRPPKLLGEARMKEDGKRLNLTSKQGRAETHRKKGNSSLWTPEQSTSFPTRAQEWLVCQQAG